MTVHASLGNARAPQRYIAERHSLEIVAPESDLPKCWEATVNFCGTLQCEVLSSKMTARTENTVPSGSVSLRVAPPDLAKLLAYLPTLGTVAQHSTEREDETDAVIDTEAKLKNLTAFRDNLRAMLARPAATVKDLIDIQQQLTDTQAQLDSETARRKALANETEKIAVGISFEVPAARRSGGGWSEIGDALRDAGSDLAGSVAALITVVVSVTPWLVVIVPLIWLAAKAWRKLRRRRASASAPPPAAA